MDVDFVNTGRSSVYQPDILNSIPEDVVLQIIERLDISGKWLGYGFDMANGYGFAICHIGGLISVSMKMYQLTLKYWKQHVHTVFSGPFISPIWPSHLPSNPIQMGLIWLMAKP
jgi:hypothetical protein